MRDPPTSPRATAPPAHAVGAHVEIADPEDVDRSLVLLSAVLAARLRPESVHWREAAAAQAHLLDDSAAAPSAAVPAERSPRAALLALPAGFGALARVVAMHRESDRFLRLHRFASRLAEQPRRWQDTLDPERIQLDRMAREIRREIHKMHAFVRFRVVADPQVPDGTRHVAWFEPVHHVARAASPFFVQRFAAMHWSILTPRLTVHWDRVRLRFGPGADPSGAPPPDAGEALWLAYYRSIFNPSRLNPQMMAREMPRRYWANLPEASLIPELVREAPARSARMRAHVEAARPRRPASGAASDRLADTGGRPADASPGANAAAAAAAHDTADSRAARLRDLALRARHCSECAFARAATQTVWGAGAPDARLMIVGEQPGDQEDLAGRPFVGPAGQLLQRAITRLGWPAESLYLTNAVKHFRFEPRGRRRIHKTPGQLEAQACAQWLEAEIANVRPRAILALGATAASSLLGRPVRVGDGAGHWLVRDDGRPVLIVHHPAAVLRQAESGAPGFEAWVDAMRPAGSAWSVTP